MTMLGGRLGSTALALALGVAACSSDSEGDTSAKGDGGSGAIAGTGAAGGAAAGTGGGGPAGGSAGTSTGGNASGGALVGGRGGASAGGRSGSGGTLDLDAGASGSGGSPPVQPCTDGTSLAMVEVFTGTVDYVVLRNRSTSCSIDLDGFVIEGVLLAGFPLLFPTELPPHELGPGEEVTVIEISTADAGAAPVRPGDIEVDTLFVSLELGGARVLLCSGPCAGDDAGAPTVIDLVVAGTATVDPPLSFDSPLPVLADAETESYHRTAFVGSYPAFVEADWEVGPASRPTVP